MSDSVTAVAVVIATRDRPHLLSERALSSVTAQTRSPEFIVVVDDSSPDVRATNQGMVEALRLPGCRAMYLKNRRTEGASGSWNTALEFLLAEVALPDRLFVAILDDDDAWRPTYLERCLATARADRLDMVAADLRRIESADGDDAIEEAPEVLRADDCLVGNPGIQGSNIFARLSVLLAAGGFDEALRSTTDRDLCIRIADLGAVRYGRLPEPLVDHFAEPDRTRLSTRGSSAKLDGLSAFWRKHAGRMSRDQRRAFSKRAGELFDWTAPTDPSFLDGSVSDDARPVALILGLVVRNDRRAELLETVRVLAACRDAALVGLDVVLFEREPRGDEAASIEVAARVIRDAGAGCFCFTLERQAELPASLDECCDVVARGRPGAEVWQADTPRRFDGDRRDGISDVLRWLGAVRRDVGTRSEAPSATYGTRGLEWWVQQERVATAEHRVRHRYALGRIRVLGSGSESVVFTDEHTVYKCIDYWKSRMPRSRLDFLREQVGRWASVPGLYALREVAEDGPWAVLSYEYESSTPYRGGHEEELVALLNGCSAAGIVCNNVHPKNLIVTDDGVKLIDYGSDIRPWSSLGFEHMARRAYLTCHHAAHPDLQALMRRALIDLELAELEGYQGFRSRLVDPPPAERSAATEPMSRAPHHPPLSLYVGVITSNPTMLLPLLRGLVTLAKAPSIVRLVTVVLDNASPDADLVHVLGDARRMGLDVAVVSVARQRQDALVGAFGGAVRARPDGQVGIAAARTMLQRYLGELMERDPGSLGWLLDEDMRVDDRARRYLSWLPAFREEGVDVLFGAYEGSSPNPPLNGLRGQLVDIFHNLMWLRQLPAEALLPDRSAENAALRRRFPDYYYDLSRKHTAHLEMPHWLEPVVKGETVAEAYARLIAGALGILSGVPLTRPIITTVPAFPLETASDSVNRGGCTFVINHRALTLTPNTTPLVQGREARRSDMIWAIVNRHYRRMKMKAVAFPVFHTGRTSGTPSLNLEKVQGEIIGSALYAGLTEFLGDRPHHALDFSAEETLEIGRLSEQHLTRRLLGLQQSFCRIAGIREAIGRVASAGEFDGLLTHLDAWFSPGAFDRLRTAVRAHGNRDVVAFLASLRSVADDYASATVDTDFIQAQLRAGIAS